MVGAPSSGDATGCVGQPHAARVSPSGHRDTLEHGWSLMRSRRTLATFQYLHYGKDEWGYDTFDVLRLFRRERSPQMKQLPWVVADPLSVLTGHERGATSRPRRALAPRGGWLLARLCNRWPTHLCDSRAGNERSMDSASAHVAESATTVQMPIIRCAGGTLGDRPVARSGLSASRMCCRGALLHQGPRLLDLHLSRLR